MVDLHITRLVKRESGDPTFETIDDEAEVVKLAGRHAPLDVVEQFGVDAARDAALDAVSRLAIGAGFDAMRDAGLPLVMRYKTTTLGSRLPERWGLPDALRDDTGVIFASAFPGYDAFADDLSRYYADRGRRDQLLALGHPGTGLLDRHDEGELGRLHGPQAEAAFREVGADARGRGVALGTRQHGREVLHHARVAVQPREGREVLVAPRPQHQARRAQGGSVARQARRLRSRRRA